MHKHLNSCNLHTFSFSEFFSVFGLQLTSTTRQQTPWLREEGYTSKEIRGSKESVAKTKVFYKGRLPFDQPPRCKSTDRRSWIAK